MTAGMLGRYYPPLLLSSMLVAMGWPLDTLGPIVTAALTIACALVALWRFPRMEL